MSSKQAEFLVKLRDGAQMLADAASEFLKSMAPPELGLDKEPTAVQEITFTMLKFDPQKGAQLGDYDVAYKAVNIEEKWIHAFNVLKSSNATIQNRYHGQVYQYSYWIYGENKIYRQKLKPKA
jgi:hypothetical protein